MPPPAAPPEAHAPLEDAEQRLGPFPIGGQDFKLSWDASHEVLFFGADDQDPWLKVSIDGQQGWIHTQEDFDAVGVPRAG